RPAGTRCLLGKLSNSDDASIVCITGTHRDKTNPPRREGRLSSLNALEYGAQAAAIHGGLRARAAGTIAPACYLAALRDAHLYVGRLDDLASPLEIRAQRSFGDAGNTIYHCAMSASRSLVADGRIRLMLRPCR